MLKKEITHVKIVVGTYNNKRNDNDKGNDNITQLFQLGNKSFWENNYFVLQIE